MNRPLLVCATLMTTLVLASVVGIVVDERTLLGESVWVKPAKFGFAFALYTGTLAWMLTKLRKGRRIGRWFGTVFAVTAIVEVGAITAQAARGTFSHFNANQDDPITLALVPILTYGVMIILIAQLVLAGVVLLQRTGDAALNRALRTGLLMATFGMVVPLFWMVAEINPRAVTDANGVAVRMYQGHGIGDPDGNGMPLTGWSMTGGDFRVPHFFALHGIQVLLLVTALLGVLAARHVWLRDEKVRARLVGAVALGYWGLVAVVTWQAGRGQSFAHPDTATLAASGAVALVTVALAVRAIVSGRRAAAAGERKAHQLVA
ncbi:hypothetical protein [Nonomuraea soli]|uniref:Uncharacterized protein n=1 Tax=Nonomuraea soli TaxID=1032476 RepID=A0A7W0CUJ8_9ACTN|nr:hypothetical protein [Nonomuraea soli]MBA2897576.1 hypothetical protein [Nonomuraea soli]